MLALLVAASLAFQEVPPPAPDSGVCIYVEPHRLGELSIQLLFYVSNTAHPAPIYSYVSTLAYQYPIRDKERMKAFDQFATDVAAIAGGAIDRTVDPYPGWQDSFPTGIDVYVSSAIRLRVFRFDFKVGDLREPMARAGLKTLRVAFTAHEPMRFAAHPRNIDLSKWRENGKVGFVELQDLRGPETITVAFSRHWDRLAWTAIYVSLVMIAAALVTRLFSTALAEDESQPPEVRYSRMRTRNGVIMSVAFLGAVLLISRGEVMGDLAWHFGVESVWPSVLARAAVFPILWFATCMAFAVGGMKPGCRIRKSAPTWKFFTRASIFAGLAVFTAMLFFVSYLEIREGWSTRAWILWAVELSSICFLMRLLSAGAKFGVMTSSPKDPDPALRGRILRLAGIVGVRLDRMAVTASEKFKVANALASGLFLKRIFICDYLVNNLTEDEVDTVVIHELAHLKLHHTRIRVVVGWAMHLALGIGGYFVCKLALRTDEPVLGIVLGGIVALLIKMQGRKWYRDQEYAADALVAKLAPRPEVYPSALAKITALTLGSDFTDKEEPWLSHPTPANRVKAFKELLPPPPPVVV